MSTDLAGKDFPLELKKFDTLERMARREAKSLEAAERRAVASFVLGMREMQQRRRDLEAVARHQGGPGQAAFWYGQHNRMTVLIELAGFQLLEQPVQIAALARVTNLSRPSVREILAAAQARGYVDGARRLSDETQDFFYREIEEYLRAHVRGAALLDVLRSDVRHRPGRL